MLVRARRCDRAQALERCSRLPTQPLQVASWIYEGGLEGGPGPSDLFLEPRGGGLAFISEWGVVMPHLQRKESIRELAWRLGYSARVIVGPKWATSTLWTHFEQRGIKARIVRDQVGYIATRDSFYPQTSSLKLDVASTQHLEALVQASAAMALEESKDDPARRNPSAFKERIAARIRKKRDFILYKNDQLLFKVNVCALSPFGGHIEGVYTRPSARRRGIGLAGITWITRWILERSPCATLLVNKDNITARRIYEKIGYQQIYESRTILAT